MGEVNGVAVSIVSELNDSSYDAVVLVTYPTEAAVRAPQAIEDFVTSARAIDNALEKVGNRIFIICSE